MTNFINIHDDKTSCKHYKRICFNDKGHLFKIDREKILEGNNCKLEGRPEQFVHPVAPAPRITKSRAKPKSEQELPPVKRRKRKRKKKDPNFKEQGEKASKRK